jgi:PAS domain S-box-containing protein
MVIAVASPPLAALAWHGMNGELAVALCFLFAAGYLAWRWGGELSGPLANLREELHELAARGMARPVPVEGPAELRAFAKEFNAMAQIIEDARRRLEVSERRFRELTELSSDWYWETDAEHRFSFVSSGAERFFGAKVGQSIGRARWEIDFLGMTAADWAKHRAQLDRGKAFEDLRLARRTPSGAVVRFSVSGRPVYDAEGRLCGYRGVGHDITDSARMEEELRGERDLLARVIETMAEGVVIFDAEGRYLRMNAVAERILGASQRQLQGRTLEDLPVQREPFGPGDEAGECVFWRLRDGASPEAGRLFHLVRPDGSRILVSRNAARIEDGDGRFQGVIATFEDVTQRVRNEERNRLFLAATPDGFWVIDRQGRIEEVNEAMCRLTGMSRQEIVGRRVWQVLEGVEEASVRQRIARVANERHCRFEAEHLGREGRRMALEVNATYVDADGGRIYAFFHDVTERRRQEALVVNIARGVSAEVGDAFFRSLTEHLARELGADYAYVGELTGSADERVRTLAFHGEGVARPGFEYCLAGTPCLGAIARRGTVVYPARAAELFPEDGDLAKLGVEGYVGQALVGADGRPLGILVVMSRRPIERSAFWASMIRIFGARAAAEVERARAEAMVRQTNESLEQTVHERTAQLEAANRELESFNYSISHDLRQPLNAIAGFAELLRDNPSLAAEATREIEHNAARMEQLIDALLRLSSAGRAELRRAPMEMQRLVAGVARDCEAGARAEIVVGDLPDARGDAALVRQVWANLIGNAVKYSRDSATPRVEISGERRDGLTEYTVRDNGVGFDMRDAPRIFDPFQRLPSGKDFEGSGVGLAIVQRIVRRHGGTVSAESAPGQGATFRFSLPD